MVRDMINSRQAHFLNRLSKLPHNIARLKTDKNIIEFVLHELCHEHCLNLKKAAYFIDNKDFDCFHGIAGIDNTELFHAEDIWNAPETFINYMNNKQFNAQVKNIRCSRERYNHETDEQALARLGNELGVASPHYAVVPLKYDNKGIIIYEPCDTFHKEEDNSQKGFSFLGLCPLF